MTHTRLLLAIGALALGLSSCGAPQAQVPAGATQAAPAPQAAAEPRQEAVTVPAAGGIVLTGTLHLPAAPGAAPAVVLFPGSQGSRNLAGLAEHLAAQGVVALDLNKRGVDGSGGHWRDESIERLSEDALAAVRFLQEREEADPRRVGIAGHSQGGWVAQLAAARSGDVAFIVLLAGPAQTVREQILTDERHHLAGWGVPPEEVGYRIAMFGDFMEAALTNPAVCGPQGGHYLCGLFRYDPAAALAAIRVPVLALYGENDPMTPPEENLDRLAAALAHLGEDGLRQHVFPLANHVFWASETGLRDEYARIPREYVPGFLDMVSSWILGLEAAAPAPQE